MKRLQTAITRLLVGFALISIGFAAGKHAARTADASAAHGSDGAERGTEVMVYYMHASIRCVTCNALEDLTHETVKKEFADEVRAGVVRVKSVNFQKDETLAERYEVAASGVVVALRRGGTDVKYERLDGVWALMQDPDGFTRRLSELVRGYLNEARS